MRWLLPREIKYQRRNERVYIIWLRYTRTLMITLYKNRDNGCNNVDSKILLELRKHNEKRRTDEKRNNVINKWPSQKRKRRPLAKNRPAWKGLEETYV